MIKDRSHGKFLQNLTSTESKQQVSSTEEAKIKEKLQIPENLLIPETFWSRKSFHCTEY